ncbi:MAG: chorismate-binding protein, partial [Bacteroidales bacterium]
MLKSITIPSDNIPDLKEKLLEYARENEVACILDSNSSFYRNNSRFRYKTYDLIAGFSSKLPGKHCITAFRELENICRDSADWYLGFLSYDLKNDIEDLRSENHDQLCWPPVFFFMPELLITQTDEVITISTRNDADIQRFISRLNVSEIRSDKPYSIKLYPRISRREYLKHAEKIKKLIRKGYIYEMNFCQEFYNYAEIDPYAAFRFMNMHSPSPFAAFFKLQDKFLLSSSPERFLKKERSLIISQPMKGTSVKALNSFRDNALKQQFLESIKEQSENIMIVDLVRNDLSRIARKNTVRV